MFQSKSKYGRSAVVPERDTAKLRASLPPQPPWGLRRADWTDPAKRSTAHPGACQRWVRESRDKSIFLA